MEYGFMKKRFILLYFIIFTGFSFEIMQAEIKSRSEDSSIKKVLKKKLNRKKSKAKNKQNQKEIEFRFKATDLIDVINKVAEAKGVNVIFPMGESAIKEKVTIDIEEKVTVEQAWDLLQTILDVAGYSMAQKGTFFSIVKFGPQISREPFPIYVSTPYDKLPNSDERIIYLMYFSNIQIPAGEGGGGQDLVSKLLSGASGLLAKGAAFKVIPSANGVMIIDRANNIRSIARILSELDKVGFKEKLEVVRLRYASANLVADLFNKKIIGMGQRGRYRFRSKKKSETSYFEASMKIIPEPRTNTIILVGKQQAIDRVKDFIFTYVDVPIGQGRSVLHRKKLDYLNAEDLKKVLDGIIAGGAQEGVQARFGGSQYGPERFFRGVIVETDKPPSEESGVGNEEEKGRYRYSGTNSLIIAATKDDWERLEKLIDELDKPRPQVIIEVLIVDIVLDDNRFLGSNFRLPGNIPMMRFSKDGKPVEFQSAQYGGVVRDPMTYDSENKQYSNRLAGDLYNEPASNPVVAADISSSAAGETIVSLSDTCGETWSILKVISVYDNTKILSHPYVVAINNQEAVVRVGEERLVQGEATQGSGGAVTREIQKVQADLTVKIKPRIGSLDSVNLQVDIDIDEFINATVSGSISDGNRDTRKIQTNANVKTGDILALGGLIRLDVTESTSPTPVLGQIPILGWLFKRKSLTRKKNNLTVFIRPTIIEPKLRGGIGDYTKDYINLAKEYVQEGMLFDTLRDPVTRWFFKADIDARDVIDLFTDELEKGYREREEDREEKKETLDDLVEKSEDELFKKGEDYTEAITQNQEKRIYPQSIEDLSDIEVASSKSSVTDDDSRDKELKALVADTENPIITYLNSIG